MAIAFRPHHFLCAFCFKGRGYSPAFIANFKQIMAQLMANDTTPIEIINHTDSICAPCPHRTNKTCTSQEKISKLDQAHATALDIKVGERITWREAKKIIAEKISLETFHYICADCEWKAYGICEEVLQTK